VGQTVYIDRKGDAGRAHARLLEMRSGELVIDVPMVFDSSDSLPLPPGRVLQVSYRAPDGTLCYFDAVALGHGTVGTLSLALSARGDVSRIQADARGRTVYSVRFTEVSDTVQQRIIQYVFRMQLRERLSL